MARLMRGIYGDGVKLFGAQLFGSKRASELFFVACIFVFVAFAYFTSPTIFVTVDYVRYYQWNFGFLRHSMAAGGIPLWNPYIGLGRPFLADCQSAVFY